LLLRLRKPISGLLFTDGQAGIVVVDHHGIERLPVFVKTRTTRVFYSEVALLLYPCAPSVLKNTKYVLISLENSPTVPLNSRANGGKVAYISARGRSGGQR